MATAVASRFAVLSLDDDDDRPTKVKKADKKKDEGKSKQVAGSAKGSDPKKKNKNKKKPESSNSSSNAPSKSKKSSSDGGSKPANSTKAKKASDLSEVQWEEWKKKDNEFVSDSYEQDLHEAVLQSKIEFEERRKMKGSEDGQPPGGKGARKRSKPQTMSLEQFNNPQGDAPVDDRGDEEMISEADALFFEQVNEETRQALNQELHHERVRVRQTYVQEAVTIAQYQDQLEKRDTEINALRIEVERLQNELQDVRSRNSKLCTILAQGEMKDKLGVLLEVETLQSVREELTSEVQSLHAQLEQERSKVRALTAAADPKKNKGKKKTASESGP